MAKRYSPESESLRRRFPDEKRIDDIPIPDDMEFASDKDYRYYRKRDLYICITVLVIGFFISLYLTHRELAGLHVPVGSSTSQWECEKNTIFLFKKDEFYFPFSFFLLHYAVVTVTLLTLVVSFEICGEVARNYHWVFSNSLVIAFIELIVRSLSGIYYVYTYLFCIFLWFLGFFVQWLNASKVCWPP